MTDPVSGAEAAQADQQSPRSWHYRAVIWSVLLAALAYLVLALWGGRAGVASAVRDVGAVGVAVALGLSLVNYALRFARWHLYLGAMGKRVPVRQSLLIYVAGFALTTTPAKAGEMLRGVLLKPHGVSYVSSLAAMLSERMSDVLAIVILSMLGLTLLPGTGLLLGIGVCVFAGAYAFICSQWLARRMQTRGQGQGKVANIMMRLVETLAHARQCNTPGVLVAASSLSLVAWAAEAFAFHLVLHWMGADIGVLPAASIYAISMLAGAASFMPGGLGGAEAAMIALLKVAGVDTQQAISATLIIRLATLWFAVGLGFVALAILAREPPAKSGASVRSQ